MNQSFDPSVGGSTSARRIGYCTNVHAGVDLPTAQANLETFACRAKEIVGDGEPLGIGLWLAEEAAQQAIAGDVLPRLKNWLGEHGLRVFTMNGFPQGNFHQKVVKHRVYEPTWATTSRLHYTQSLVQILDGLLDEGEVGSISTLPIAWGSPTWSHEALQQAAGQLKTLAGELQRLHETNGREIVIAMEPEPGCVFGDSASLRTFFERYLTGDQESTLRKYITVCHDVCHAAVMREDQNHELQAYKDAGIRVGKVQVSSCVEVDWDTIPVDDRRRVFDRFGAFAEDRYLHQTSVCESGGKSFRLMEDLPPLLAEVANPRDLSGSWRVHFHVPIFAEKLEAIGTTQREIRTCLDFMQKQAGDSSFFTGHWEIETYAWGVLPREFAPSDLAAGIAEEVLWFKRQIGN